MAQTITMVHASVFDVLRGVALAIGFGMLLGSAACRPSDVLVVPPPAGVTPSSAYQNQTGAEGLLAVGKGQVFQGLAGGAFSSKGLLPWSGVLGDEFTWAYFIYFANDANIDARMTVGTGGFQESGDAAIQLLLRSRLTLMSAVPELEQHEPASGQSKIGEAFALVGYVELLVAEDYCAGAVLDALVPVKGVQYGAPLTTDSLLGAATADFDSAAAHAGGNATIAALAAVGSARALLDRGQFAAAAAAVRGVPTSFVYNTELELGSGAPGTFNLYGEQTQYMGCGYVNVGDRKGGNGLNFVSAQDPRLVLSTTAAKTCDGLYGGSADSVWYQPVKFGNPSTYVPLATGVEARLIEAEAALRGNDVGTWAAGLSALRGDTASTHVMFDTSQVPIKGDSTTGANAAAQVDFLFRERALWLFGTGTRLGDMRRLVRQYGRDQSAVFPVGPYPSGHNPNLPSPLPSYGTDVNLTLPTSAGGLSTPNPNYKGCVTSTNVA
jgi:hypothetical protein